MIIVNEKAFVQSINVPLVGASGVSSGEEIRFLPGSNVIPDDKAKFVLDHPVVKARLKAKPPVLTVLVPPAKKGSAQRAPGDDDLVVAAKEITATPSGDAISLISTLADIHLLRTIRDHEDRPSVLKALDQRIHELTSHRKDGE